MTSIEIRRFGPIYRGEISLSPLTVLIGPNGSGKSYAAMVLHSLTQGEETQSRRSIRRRPSYLAESYLDEAAESEIEELQQCGQKLIENGEASVSRQLFNEVTKYYYEIFFENRLNDVLESVFATDLEDLIKKGHRGFRFDIKTELGNSRLDCYSTYDGLEIKDVPDVSSQPLLKVSESIGSSMGNTPKTFKDDDRLIIPIPDIDQGVDLDLSEAVVARILFVLQSHTDLRYPSSSHYLPAGRAGLLQSHEVLTTGAFDRLSRVGLEPIEVPAFSGVVSNYLRDIVSLSSRNKGKLAEIAHSFEEDILEGKVMVQSDEDKPHPKITFEKEESEFQLHIASTSVSELAPLILYTKYILSPESTIVIEEPEAHLHPENQRKIAYFIVNLVESGVRVIVTTHSDFILEQINNLIRLSKISTEEKEEAGLVDLPSISPGDVSANSFSYDEDKEGYRIRDLNINPIDGIPMEEFGQVSEELYGEGHKIDSLLQKHLNGDIQ